MGTMSLVVVLSVFNGIEELVLSMVNTFDPHLKVMPVEGKVFNINSIDGERIAKFSDVQNIVYVIEDHALAEYNGQQYVVKVKGVSSNYQDFIPIDSMMMEGRFILEQGDKNYASLGAGVWYHLNVNTYDKMTMLMLIAPERSSSKTIQSHSFTVKPIMPESVFSVEQSYDQQYVIVPLRFAAQLFQYDSLINVLEVWCDDQANVGKTKKIVQDIVGEEFKVLDRQEQQVTLYKIMRSEKWAVFLILTFILLVASFNMISSISIIIIDKKKDMFILHSMGASLHKIRTIFLMQGMVQTFIGTVVGLLLGLFLCWIQIYFGLVPLGGEGSSFVVTSYPVSIKLFDLILVVITTHIIGFITAVIPAFRVNSLFLKTRD